MANPMKKRTLVRAVVLFVVSVALVIPAAHAVFAEDDPPGEIQVPPPGEGKIAGIGGSGTVNYIPKFVGSTTLGNSVVYELNGNVGLGTTNPLAKLDVASTSVSGIRYIKSGSKDARITVGDPTKSWSMASGWATAGDFSIIEEGVAGDRLYIKQGGSVGIGTTSPANALHVARDINAVPQGDDAQLMVGGSTNTNKRLMLGFDTTDNYGWIGAVEHGVVWRNLSLVPAGGNVGIGTTSPVGLLNVHAASSDPVTLITRGDDVPGNTVTLRMGNNNPTYKTFSSYIQAIQGSGIDAYALAFGTSQGTLAAERMRITTTGNVGIGTTSPSQKLDVAGYVKGQSGLCIGDDCRTSWPSGGGGGGTIDGGGSTNYVAKFTGSNSIGNGAIFDNGNVGIGTTSPVARLDVATGSGNALHTSAADVADNAMAVFGQQTAGGGNVFGVQGETAADGRSPTDKLKGQGNCNQDGGCSSGSAAGVYGRSTNKNDIGDVFGVLGEVNGIGGAGPGPNFAAGVYGISYAKTGVSAGVWGESNSSNTSAAGTIGKNNAETGDTRGVWGEVKSVDGVGIFGRNGLDTADTTVGHFENGRNNFANILEWYNGVLYGIRSGGSLATTMNTQQGDVSLFATVSPDSWVEDYGEGALVKGKVHIALDPTFLSGIAVTPSQPFKVFIQPTGKTPGMFVQRSTTGFDVVEQNNGKGNASFTYRIVAKRKGYENARFQTIPRKNWNQ